MKSLQYIVFMIIVLVLFSIVTCANEQDDIRITARVDRDTVRIGDIITYTVEVEWDKGVSIIGTAVGNNFGKFSIVKAHPAVDKMSTEGKQARLYSYEVAAYETGELGIPPFTIKYMGAGGIEKSADSLPLMITITSVLPDNTENLEPRPLKPQAEIPPDYSRLYRALAIAAGALAFLFGGILLIRKYLRRRKPEEYKRMEPLRPAEDIAREQLLALRKSSLLPEGKVKEYFSRGADIIREYAGRRYDIPALDMTTLEIIYLLGQRYARECPSGEVIEALQAFLEECDLVKFAKFIPPRERWDVIINEALGIVNATTPQSPEKVSADVAS